MDMGVLINYWKPTLTIKWNSWKRRKPPASSTNP